MLQKLLNKIQVIFLVGLFLDRISGQSCKIFAHLYFLFFTLLAI